MHRFITFLFCALPLSSLHADFATDWIIGDNDGSTAGFERENMAGDHYYLENGDFTTVGGIHWSQGREPTTVTPDVGLYDGFERAIHSTDPSQNVYFLLGARQASTNAQLQFTVDLILLGSGSSHDLEFRLNDTLIHSVTNITAARVETITGSASAFAAQPGPNKFTVTRTGGGTSNPWVQFDYMELKTDPPPLIQSFTTDRTALNPGETAQLSWVCDTNVTSLSIAPTLSDVTSVTTNGTGSIQFTPLGTTNYTLTVNSGTETDTAPQVTITRQKYATLWTAGIDNNNTSEMSHEFAADDDYYFAGDYTSIGGPVQVADELLIDDTPPVPPYDGDPAIGYERALTIGDPHSNIWFILGTNNALPEATFRFTLEVNGMTPGSSHDLEFTFNGNAPQTVTGINSSRIITIEWSGHEISPVIGPNKITYRRLEHSTGSYMVFDLSRLEQQVTPALISSITNDGILGTRTIFWNGFPGETYHVQRSISNQVWSTLTHGFPRNGATVEAQFFEDRVTPFAFPQPAYRIFQE